jgi:hypothetical protein
VSKDVLRVFLDTAISSPFEEGDVWSGIRLCSQHIRVPLQIGKALRKIAVELMPERYGIQLTMSTDLGRENKDIFNPSDWISQTEAAELRGVTRQAIARLVKKERFKTLEIGRKKLLYRPDVIKYENKAPGPAPKPKRKRKKTHSSK